MWSSHFRNSNRVELGTGLLDLDIGLALARHSSRRGWMDRIEVSSFELCFSSWHCWERIWYMLYGIWYMLYGNIWDMIWLPLSRLFALGYDMIYVSSTTSKLWDVQAEFGPTEIGGFSPWLPPPRVVFGFAAGVTGLFILMGIVKQPFTTAWWCMFATCILAFVRPEGCRWCPYYVTRWCPSLWSQGL